jgi:WD40 repeat protein
MYSGAWDHSVRLWDVEMESNLITLNCEKVVVSMTYCEELKLLVTGHEDGVLRMWDPRSRGIVCDAHSY